MIVVSYRVILRQEINDIYQEFDAYSKGERKIEAKLASIKIDTLTPLSSQILEDRHEK